jgi:uncharacterized protein involved in exopolysaccharide biosynthesis
MSDFQVSEFRETAVPRPNHPESIDLLDVLVVLARDPRRILIVTIAALLLGATAAFLVLRPTFTATATILPPQQSQSTLQAFTGQLGILAGLGGGGFLKNPADMYVSMITRRTVFDRMIERFHLQDLYHTRKMDDTRKAFKAHITTEAGKDGLIQISVKDTDPRRASELTNGLVDELYRLTSSLAITEAAQRRLFFDEQMEEEKKAVSAAEEDLRKTQEKTGMIQLTGQAEAIIRGVAELRAQIVSLEVQIQSMRTFATDQNPELTRLQGQLTALRQQLAVMENDQRKMAPGDIQVPTGRVPEVALEYLRKLRDVTYHNALFALLSKQYEAARIDEAKSSPVIQVVDNAVPPDKKSGPPRALIVLGAGLLGFIAGCFWVLVRNGLTRMRNDPETALKLNELSTAFRRRSSTSQSPLDKNSMKY